MPLVVNLRHLEEHDVVLRGELPLAELDLDPCDEMVRVTHPLRHELEVQLLERACCCAVRCGSRWSASASAV